MSLEDQFHEHFFNRETCSRGSKSYFVVAAAEHFGIILDFICIGSEIKQQCIQRFKSLVEIVKENKLEGETTAE